MAETPRDDARREVLATRFERIRRRLKMVPVLHALGFVVSEKSPLDADGYMNCGGARFSTHEVAVNLNSGRWFEALTGDEGNLIDLVCRQLEIEGDPLTKAEHAMDYLESMVGKDKRILPATVEPLAPERIAYLHAKLKGEPLKRLCAVTGLTTETLRQYRIGFKTHAKGTYYLIPIPDADGVVRAMRGVNTETWDSYALWHGPTGGALSRASRLYGIDELARDEAKAVIICSGEFDRLRLQQDRGPSGYLALACPMQFREEWIASLKGRQVRVVATNEKEAAEWSRTMIPALESARRQGILAGLSFTVLAVPICEMLRDNFTFTNLLTVIEKAKELGAVKKEAEPGLPMQLADLSHVEDPAVCDHRVSVDVTVAGESSVVFSAPSAFRVVHCSQTDRGKCCICQGEQFTIPLGSAESLEACGSKASEVTAALQRRCCPFGARPRIEVTGKINFREVVLRPYSMTAADRMPRVGETVGRCEHHAYLAIRAGGVQALEPCGYKAVGWVRTHPRTSAQTLIIEDLERIPEPYERYDPAVHRDVLERLRALGPKTILDDLSNHLTRMPARRDLLSIMLLSYCTPLALNFQGERIRGWLNAVIVGDTATGKSRTFELLAEAAGVGYLFTCQTGRRTGLLYTITRGANSNWHCQAGMLPLASRKILAIEEAQVFPREDLRRMGEAIDTGQMDVGMAARDRYETKTRVIFLANALRDKPLSAYRQGCAALADLFPAPFLRRFDLAAVVQSPENADYNAAHRPTGDAKVKPGDLSALVYWCWSRTDNQILFSHDATQATLDIASKLSGRFGRSDEIPLLHPAVARFTLARLGCAWAMLSVSSPDFNSVEILPQHLALAEELLTSLYSAKSCALDQYNLEAGARQTADLTAATTAELARRILVKPLDALQGGGELSRILALLSLDSPMSTGDLESRGAGGERAVAAHLGWLARTSLITGDSAHGYVLTPRGTRVLALLERDHKPAYAAILIAREGLRGGSEDGGRDTRLGRGTDATDTGNGAGAAVPCGPNA